MEGTGRSVADANHLEAAVLIVVILAARQGRTYIYGLAFAFGADVFYDFARYLQRGVEGTLLSGLFLIASTSALVAVWGLYKDQPR